MSSPYKRKYLAAHCSTCQTRREPLVKLCALIQWSHGLCQLQFWCISCQTFQLSTFNPRLVHVLLDRGVQLIELEAPTITEPHRTPITQAELMKYNDWDQELANLTEPDTPT